MSISKPVDLQKIGAFHNFKRPGKVFDITSSKSFWTWTLRGFGIQKNALKYIKRI